MIGPLLIGLAPLPILAIVVGIFLFARSGERIDAAPGDVRLPLSAAFGSRAGLGPFAGTHNSLNPLLIFHAGAVEYRVVRRSTSPYAEIASVEVSAGRWSNDIVLTFAGGYRFTGRTRDRAALAAALKLLQAKGCPLSPDAAAFAEMPAA